MPDQNRRSQPLVIDERRGVGCSGLNRIVQLAAPLRVAMPSLVEGQHVITVGQMKGNQIPGVGRLVAAVQEQDGRRIVVAPLQEMESLSSHHGMAGGIPDACVVLDPQVGCAL